MEVGLLPPSPPSHLRQVPNLSLEWPVPDTRAQGPLWQCAGRWRLKLVPESRQVVEESQKPPTTSWWEEDRGRTCPALTI